MNEKEFYQSVETGLRVAGVPFSELKAKFGIRRALRTYLSRFRYIRQLWIMREIAIICSLYKYFDKVPRKTPTYYLISVFKRSAPMRRVLLKLASKYNLNVSFKN